MKRWLSDISSFFTTLPKHIYAAVKINTNTWNRIRYTLYTPFYDLLGSLLNRMRRQSIELLDIKEGDKVLIVGAGTGLDLKYIPINCAVTATDLTPAMVMRILKRKEKLHINASALVMDAQQLTFPNETFDKVILHLIVAVVPEPLDTLRQAERVVKEGGSIVILDKFIRKGRQASLLRKSVNLVTNLLFSDITRNIEDLISQTNLTIVEDQKAEPSGNFRIMLLKK